MTSGEVVIVRNAPEFHQARTKYRSIPKRVRSKMKRAVKRGAIRSALVAGQTLQTARLLHRKSWHFLAAERRKAAKPQQVRRP